MNYRNKWLWLCLLILPCLNACKKNWLEAKPDKNLVVPESLSDLQGLLDNTNNIFNKNQPGLGEIGSDDYYIGYDNWQLLYSNTEKNAYTWAKEIYDGESVADWMSPYQRIFYANYVLENIDNVPVDSAGRDALDNVKGTALFCRGFDFYSLADLFARPYDPATSDTDLGIPIRLQPDINIQSVRATVKVTFEQIITDLKASVGLLPVTPAFKTRPSKPAACAMLARTYLCMDNYDSAFRYADACLHYAGSLMDYNSLNTAATYPFARFNPEVIYHTVFGYPGILNKAISIVDSGLYKSYDTNDLRRYLFIDTTNGVPCFKGGYDGYTYFAGIATDEIYLIRAECYARRNDVQAAMNDLNMLLQTRYRQGSFRPLTALNGKDALQKILQERRKELLFRGLRWSDLRRLNKDPAFAVTLTRNLNGETYTLPPNDNRYVYPIPDNEIRLGGIEQNPR